jgi:hypothetical protein
MSFLWKKKYVLGIIVFVLFSVILFWAETDYSGFEKTVFQLWDEINPYTGETALNRFSLPEFNITLSNKDLKKLEKTLNRADKDRSIYRPVPYMSNYNNEFIKIQFRFNGEDYKGKLRFHGTDFPHFQYDKKSFYIKVSKKKLLNRVRRFSLIIPEQNSLATVFANRLYEKYAGFKIETFLCRVRINGVDQGVYLFEEKLHKSLLEKNGLSGVDIIEPFDEWDYQYRRNNARYPFLRSIANTKFKNISKRELYQLVKYEYLFSSASVSNIKKIIDEDAFALVDALRVLFGDAHQISGDNYKLLYNTSTGFFLPFFRTEDVLSPISPAPGSALFEGNLYPEENSLLRKLIRDDKYRERRNRFLVRLLEDKDKIIRQFDEIIEQQLPVITADASNNLPVFYLKKNILKKRRALEHNFREIEAYINYAKAYVDLRKISPGNYLLNIEPDANSGLEMVSCKLDTVAGKLRIEDLQTGDTQFAESGDLTKFFSGKYFLPGLDEQLRVSGRRYSYRITCEKGNKISGFAVEFINALTGRKIEDKNVLTVFIDKPDRHYFSMNYLDGTAEELIRNFPAFRFKVDRDSIFIRRGAYTLLDDMVIPSGYNLVIEKGTRIKIAPEKSIVVYGGLLIRGSETQKVCISALNSSEPFGVVGAVGGGETRCNISWLELSGGKDALINGSYLSGGLSLYRHAEVIIRNSRIHDNHADDGVNIKDAEVILENNFFKANHADQVDLDFCKGRVSGNYFVRAAEPLSGESTVLSSDANGDGLDLSGGKIIAENNVFINFLDKGVSIGEGAKTALFNNRFTDNRSAVTAKDQSEVFLVGNKYDDNTLNLELYRKKQIFDFPVVFIAAPETLSGRISRKGKSRIFAAEEKVSVPKSGSEAIFEYLEKIRWKEIE